mmetsp:Transcript_447/g.801  ORF Transcript_447/g.801 Transcript_447/m.801 type:complete len:371 (+) Transcript_447:32-1144(+)
MKSALCSMLLLASSKAMTKSDRSLVISIRGGSSDSSEFESAVGFISSDDEEYGDRETYERQRGGHMVKPRDGYQGGIESTTREEIDHYSSDNWGETEPEEEMESVGFAPESDEPSMQPAAAADDQEEYFDYESAQEDEEDDDEIRFSEEQDSDNDSYATNNSNFSDDMSDVETPSSPPVSPISNAASSPKKATVQYMITSKMKQVLTQELGYTSSEVSSMKPDVAAVVIQRRLSRPQSGMPKPWYKDPTGDLSASPKLPSFFRPFRSAFKLTVRAAPILVAGFAASHVRKNLKNDVVGELVKRTKGAVMGNKVVGGIVEDFKDVEDEVLDTGKIAKDVNKMMRDMDETWLDKIISAVLTKMSDLFSSSGF